MRICVIIPAYNEAGAIAGIVKDVRAHGFDIVVIDDGSADATFQNAQGAGAVVVRSRGNEGKGAALARGFSYALAHGYDAAVTMDGDGQHLPCDIAAFIRAADKSPSGIYVGNRMQRANAMPFVRLTTNRFMSWLVSRLSRQRIPDTQCGFRLIRREVLEKVSLSTSRYETESEILIKAARCGFAVESVPVTTVYAGEKSKINPVTDTLRFLKFIAGLLFARENKICRKKNCA